MSDGAAPSHPNAAAPPLLRAFLDAVDRLAVFGGWVAGSLLFGLTALILAEIVVRTSSNIFPSLPGDVPLAWELSSYMMGGAFAFGFAVALRAGGHIRVSILLANAPPPVRRLLDIVSTILGLGLSAFIAWAMILFTWRNFERGQVSVSSDFPTWVPQSLIALGLCLLVLQMVARLIQAVMNLPTENEAMKVASLAE